MASEALIRLGRPESVLPWAEAYRRRLDGHPVATDPIALTEWRTALGDPRRIGDWIRFFDETLAGVPWRTAVGTWVPRLSPGLMAGATHGLIRTAHAVRSLVELETPPRLHELAEGLAYWAARYQELPGRPSDDAESLTPQSALARLPRFTGAQAGLIFEAVKGLDQRPSFAGAIDLVDTAGDLSRFISDVTATFAAAFLANPAAPIAFVHSVTAPSALRMLAPHLADDDARRAARYAWQASAAIYCWYAETIPSASAEAEDWNREDLIDRAVSTGDEHGFKFTEACLREYSIDPQPIYVAAATAWVGRLKKRA